MQDYDNDKGLRASAQPALMLEIHPLCRYGTKITANVRCSSNFHLCLLSFAEPSGFASLQNVLYFHLLHCYPLSACYMRPCTYVCVLERFLCGD